MSPVITDATRPEQMINSAGALTLRLLDESTLAELTRATDKLKADLGPNPDMWAAESRYR